MLRPYPTSPGSPQLAVFDATALTENSTMSAEIEADRLRTAVRAVLAFALHERRLLRDSKFAAMALYTLRSGRCAWGEGSIHGWRGLEVVG